MDQGIGRIVEQLKQTAAVRQHADLLPAGQRRLRGNDRPHAARRHHASVRPSRRWTPIGKDALEPAIIPDAHPRRLPGRDGSGRDAGPRRHVHRLRPGLGQRLQHAVPRVQALGARRGHLHAADRALARRHQAPRRAGAAAGPSDRPDGDLRRCGRRQVSASSTTARRSSRWKAAASRPPSPARPIEREAIYWEHEGNRAVRVGPWKLVAKGPGGKWELYDIAGRSHRDARPGRRAARARQSNGCPVGNLGPPRPRAALDLAAGVWGSEPLAA